MLVEIDVLTWVKYLFDHTHVVFVIIQGLGL
jgi:hypothetical protein